MQYLAGCLHKESPFFSLHTLEWKEEAPKEKGWYWTVYAGEVDMHEVVDDRGALYVIFADEREHIKDAPKYISYWLGPIPQPEMPKG